MSLLTILRTLVFPTLIALRQIIRQQCPSESGNTGANKSNESSGNSWIHLKCSDLSRRSANLGTASCLSTREGKCRLLCVPDLHEHPRNSPLEPSTRSRDEEGDVVTQSSGPDSPHRTSVCLALAQGQFLLRK